MPTAATVPVAVRKPEDLYRYSVTAPVVPGPDALTDVDVEMYRRDGFLAVANVMTPDEVVEAKRALDDLLKGRIDGAGDVLQPEPEHREQWAQMSAAERVDLTRKLFLFCQYEARLNALATAHPVLHRLLAALNGEACRMIQDMALLKPPLVGTEKPWHQDMAYFGWGPPEKVLGVWIALDPATAENGCMHVLPGSHREGPVPHVHARDCQIPDERVQVERDVMVPLAPGGALFFSSLLHHGTPPNKSPQRRWAVQFHYAGVSCTEMSRREHADLFFEGDIYAGCRGGTGKPVSEVE